LRLKRFTFARTPAKPVQPLGFMCALGHEGYEPFPRSNFPYWYCRKLWESKGGFANGNTPPPAFFLHTMETRNVLPSEAPCASMFQVNVPVLTKKIVFIQANRTQQLSTFKI